MNENITMFDDYAIPDEVAREKAESYERMELREQESLDQDTIRGQARSRPELLGFPVVVAGNRVKIPKAPFIRFMREGIKN